MKYSYNELLKDKKAVLFDLDGTLVDSMWVWRNIDIDFLSAIGQKLPADLQKCIEGMSFTETAEYFKKRFGIDDDVEDIKKKWNQMAYDKYTSEVRLKKGAKEFLERLKSDNIRIGIASSNSVTLIEGALKECLSTLTLSPRDVRQEPESRHPTYIFSQQKRLVLHLRSVLCLRIFPWELWRAIQRG